MTNKPNFGELVLMCGIPGSGKTTAAHAYAETHNAIVKSSDDIKQCLHSNAKILGSNKEQFSTLEKEIEELLKQGKNVVYDATNVTIERRKRILMRFTGCIGGVKCIYVCTSVKEAIARNHSRESRVSDRVIKRMFKILEVPSALTEGFNELIIIR